MTRDLNFSTLDSMELLHSFSSFKSKLLNEVPEIELNKEILDALDLCNRQVQKFCAKDLSDKNHQLEKKKHLHQLTRTLQYLDDLVIILTPEFEIAYFSPSVEQALQYTKKELLGRHFTELLPIWDDKDKTMANLLSMSLYHEKVHSIRKKLSHLNGELTWFELKLSGLAFSEEMDNYEGFLLLARDIEEQVKKEDALKREKRLAEASNKQKSEYLANMSHEIRTPLNGIVGFSNILTHKKVDGERRKRYVRNIESCSKQLMTLINDIIDLSKIESGQLKFHLSEFNLHDMLSDLKTFYTSEITSSGREVKINLITPPRKKGFIIYTDEVRLRQVLMNLINNALKFTEHGKIDFGYEVISNHTLNFFVKDTGKGVPVEFQPYIFDAYQQAKDTKNGSGLGLAICKGLVENLNGSIQLQTEIGKGTEFSFQLPVSA